MKYAIEICDLCEGDVKLAVARYRADDKKLYSVCVDCKANVEAVGYAANKIEHERMDLESLADSIDQVLNEEE